MVIRHLTIRQEHQGGGRWAGGRAGRAGVGKHRGGGGRCGRAGDGEGKNRGGGHDDHNEKEKDEAKDKSDP